MASSPSAVFDAAAGLLDALTEGLGEDAPGRAFVSPGPPAFDCCPQLSVHASLLRRDRTNPGGGMCVSTFQVVLTADVIWCVPVGNGQKPPGPVELERAASIVARGGWLAYNAALGWAGTVLDGSVDPALPIAPQGGCAGWRLVAMVGLEALGGGMSVEDELAARFAEAGGR